MNNTLVNHHHKTIISSDGDVYKCEEYSKFNKETLKSTQKSDKSIFQQIYFKTQPTALTMSFNKKYLVSVNLISDGPMMLRHVIKMWEIETGNCVYECSDFFI
jgi:hypothetical protein